MATVARRGLLWGVSTLDVLLRDYEPHLIVERRLTLLCRPCAASPDPKAIFETFQTGPRRH